jgi:hypothetical protein
MPAGRLGAVTALSALGVAFASILHSGGHVEARLRAERASYAAMPKHERDRAYITNLGLDPDPFDWFALYLHRGDRIYYQVQPSGLGRFIDLEQAVNDVGRYAFLPAKSVSTLSDANVVVSWNMDPGLLHVPFSSQERLGLQLFFVSRKSQ